MSLATELQEARKQAKYPIKDLQQGMIPDIKEYVERLNNLAKYFNVVEIFTPTNANDQKKLFLDSDIKTVEDPVFVYDTVKLQAVIEATKKVEELKEEVLQKIGGILYFPSDHQMFHKELLLSRIEDALLSGAIANGILKGDDSLTSQALIAKFGLLSDEWVQKAWKEYERIKNNEPPDYSHAPHILGFLTPHEIEYLKNATYDAHEISASFKWISRFYRFKMPWRFPISPTATACDVRSASQDYDFPAMITPATRECNGLKMLEIDGHEVEDHMRREENGNILFSGQGHAMLKGDETHLEGTAKISDIHHSAFYEGIVSATPIPWYIITIDQVAREKTGFADTARFNYEILRDAGKTHKKAMDTTWMSTYRVKRGNTKNDPSFVQPKDAGYSIGYHMERDICDAGLGQYLEMGCFSTEWILKIAENYIVEKSDLPFPHRDATRTYFERVIRPNM